MGKSLTVLEQRAARGEKIAVLENRPDVFEDLTEVWEAFWELAETRPAGFGPGAIPFAEIVAWLNLHGVTRRQDREDYAYLIRALDRAWLNRWCNEHGEKGKSGAGR
jgi:hypothetical protein